MSTRPLPSTHRRALAALAVGSSLALVAACGSGTQPADGGSSGGGSSNKTIVFSPLGLQIPAMKDLSTGVQAVGKAKGYSIIVQDPKLDPQKQVTDLTSVVETGKAAGVYAIAVQPSSMKALVQTAQQKKVPMILNGVPSDYGLSGLVPGLSFDTIDYAAEGQAAGEALGKCINEKYDGKGTVLFAQSAAGTAGKADFEGAVKKALFATAPDSKIVKTITVSDRTTAQTDVGNALQGGTINAVFGQNDEGALGAIGAYKSAGKALPCITEGGGNDEALAAVKSGEIYAVVALQFEQDLGQSMDTLIKMIKDPSATGQQLTVPIKVVTAGS